MFSIITNGIMKDAFDYFPASNIDKKESDCNEGSKIESTIQPSNSQTDMNERACAAESKIQSILQSYLSKGKVPGAIELCFSPEFSELNRDEQFNTLKAFQMTPGEFQNFSKTRNEIIRNEFNCIRAIDQIKKSDELAKKNSPNKLFLFSAEGLIKAANREYHHNFIGKVDPNLVGGPQCLETSNMLAELHFYIDNVAQQT